jgi:biopolymer transport protein ExbB
VNTVPDALNSLIELGGPVVMLLLALSVIGTAIVLVKLVQLRALSGAQFARAEAMLESDATPQLQSLASPIANLVEHGLDERAAGTALETLEADLARRGNRVISDCGRNLRPLELIAYLSPLLGLLGTVLGMIDAFRGLEAQTAQGDASMLAGGIWEALLTTAVGLGIAIPMTAAHALLETRVQHIAERLSQLLELVLAR